MKKFLSILLAAVMLLGLLSACGGKAAETQPSASPTQTAGGTRTFVDSAGRSVEVPTDIERIIPSGSMAQTFMWPLAADKLVSVGDKFTDEQLKYLGDKYRDLPVTGNLYKTGSKLNVEEVAKLNPQIIIDFGEPKDTIVQDLDNLQKLLGIPCIFIEGSFSNTADAYRMLGDLLNEKDQAEKIATYVDGIMSKTKDVFSKIDKKSLAFVNSTDGLGCIAKGTYFDEIWSYMGSNVATVSDAQMYSFSTISLEQLQTWNPDYMFFYSDDAYKTATTDAAWSGLKAVKEGHCYTIPKYPVDFCFTPSVNRYMGIIWLATILYPKDFDWNLKDEVYKYYDMFYHCTLTDALYNELMGIA